MAVIRGTFGDDRLVGTSRADELLGLDGDDVLIGGRGADVLNGSFGTEDAASYATARSAVVVDLADPGANTGDARGDSYLGVEWVIGSRFGDELRGGTAGGALFGGRGNDVLTGQFGTTILVGGAGRDTLIGLGVATFAGYWNASAAVLVDLDNARRNTGDAAGDRFDNIIGLEGSRFSDRLFGDERDNVLEGRLGTDRLFGRSGNDELNGGGGRDALFGGRGFDVASYQDATAGLTVDLADTSRNTGQARGDTFRSVEGIEGSDFADVLNGDAGDNRLTGGGAADALRGRDGDDQIQGGLGNDRITGGDGNDLLNGGLGADVLFGGSGFDRAIYWNAAGALTVDLDDRTENTGEARGDRFSRIEGIDGSNFSDILRGDEQGNRLAGRDGDDLLLGRDGDDQLLGGLGEDDLRGGDGRDVLYGGEGEDALFGGAGSDTASYLFATDGVTADLENAASNVGEAEGDTFNSIENLSGSADDDSLRGDDDANRISGGAGDDDLFGRGGDDVLLGDAGNDTILGSDGADVLNGGLGRDDLTGGAGADQFIFDTTPSSRSLDEIADFEVGVDDIAIRAFLIPGGDAGDTLSASNFAEGAATTAAQRIVYVESTGSVLYDADGSGAGAAVRFATVEAGLDLSASDFLLI
jgi:Ca2+-binding RTX toxin-like protein